MHEPLLSTANGTVKRLVRLHKASGRRDQQRFLLEGLRSIEAFFQAGWVPHAIYLREDLLVPEGAVWSEARTMSSVVANRISQASSASGYAAEFAIPEQSSVDWMQGGLLLDSIADPGNCGTLVRSALAFNRLQVVLVGGVDVWNHKVLQSSMGALARVQIAHISTEELAKVTAHAPLCGLFIDNGQQPEDFMKKSRWVVVGNEANGICSEVEMLCTERLTLPMHAGCESLNAAVAGSIALYHFSNV